MHQIRSLTGPLILCALFAATPQAVFGQRNEVPIDGFGQVLLLNARPGTEISSDELGEFLAKNLNVELETDMRPLSVGLRLEVISREKGTVGKYESEAVKVEPGKTYSGETWLRANTRVQDALAPGFGDRRKVRITGFGTFEDPGEAWRTRECEGATHAVRLTFASDDERTDAFTAAVAGALLCLNVEDTHFIWG